MLYVAGTLIVIGIALFVAAPLFDYGGWLLRRRPENKELAGLEHERALAIQALRELEFDRQMHKLSDEDWSALKSSLEERALNAMAKIEKLSGARPAPASARLPSARVAAATTAERFCPQCGAKVNPKSRFCAQCGNLVAIRERA